MATSGGQPCRARQRALLLGDSEGAPKKAVSLGSHPIWGGHTCPGPGPASHPALGAQSPFLGCLGAAVEALSSASVWSLPCAHHILRQRSPVQKMGPGPTLGSRGQVDRRRNPNSAAGLVLFLVPGLVPLPLLRSRGQGGGPRVRGRVGLGAGPSSAPRRAPTPALAHSLSFSGRPSYRNR